MNNKLKHGDVLIIGGQPFMIVKYNGCIKNSNTNKYEEYSYALMHIGSYDLDYLSKDMYDLKIGDIIFGCGIPDEEMNMKLEMIIPSEKVNISFKL